MYYVVGINQRIAAFKGLNYYATKSLFIFFPKFTAINMTSVLNSESGLKSLIFGCSVILALSLLTTVQLHKNPLFLKYGPHLCNPLPSNTKSEGASCCATMAPRNTLEQQLT
jgi:hypothetical protein